MTNIGLDLKLIFYICITRFILNSFGLLCFINQRFSFPRLFSLNSKSMFLI